MKKRIVWLAVARSTYNDYLFEEVAKRYDLIVVYRTSTVRTHPWQFTSSSYQTIQVHNDFPEIYELCKKADLLVVSGWGFWHYLLLALLLRHKRRVYWTDTIPVDVYFDGIRGIFRKLISMYVFRTFSQIWSTGQPGCDALRRAGCTVEKIRDFPYFVKLDRIGRADQTNKTIVQKFRNSHIAASNAVVFLGMGQFVLRKRYGDILDAMAMLNNKRVILWLAGSGPEECSLSQKAKELGLSSQIVFLGWVQPKDIDIVYKACDIFVHPAESEPFGVVVLDAMAMGKPVIGARWVGAVADRVQNGENGRVFAPGNVDQLSEAMRFFLDHPVAINEYGKRARETAERHPVESGLDLLDLVINSPRKFS